MVVFVGIDLLSKKISTYDTSNNTYESYVISAVSGEGITEEINNKLNVIKAGKELGCACVVRNDQKHVGARCSKKVLDCCISHGFKKCQMIDWRAAELYSALSYSNNYRFESDDFILACTNLDNLAIWQNQNGIFKKINNVGIIPNTTPIIDGSLLAFTISIVGSAIASVYDKVAGIKDTVKNNPKVVFHLNKFDAPIIKQFFPTSTYIEYKNYANIGALYKARMMANDNDINWYDVECFYGISLIVELNDEEIMKVEYGEILPLRKIAVKELHRSHNILKATAADEHDKEYTLPSFNKILIVLEVKSDTTYSFKCIDISNDVENKYEELFERNLITENYYYNDNDNEILDVYKFPLKIQLNNDNFNAIGIDLGTTRCCAAVNRRNGIETVALENIGGRLLPSFVSFNDEHPICGQIVVNRMRNFAQSTVFDAKRLIGEKIIIDKAWPFEINILQFLELKMDGKHEPEEKFVLKIKKGDNYIWKFPEEISAVLLKHIKTKAEEFQGKELTDAVITIPAAFSDEQIQATYDAAIFAGWETVYLLPEPVAAAFAYFIDRPIPNNSTLLLFDLGGGTLDVCIFKIEKNQLFIISKNGDRDLGGRDFDNLLVNHFENILTQIYNIEITDGKRHKLLLKCQRIKESLSVIDKENLDVEDIDPSVDANISISRNEFETISTDLIHQIKQNIEMALKTINFEPDQIDKVLQVGGGCRMPMIKNLLKEMFPKSEECAEENPDEVVAIGAAYYSCYLNQKEDKSWCSIM